MLRYLRFWLRKSPAKPVQRRTRLFVEQLEDRVVPSAVITTDLSDYAPGQTAVLTGSGFQPGETAGISVVGSNGFTQILPGNSVADANGQFTTSFVVNPNFANTQMTITAMGNLGDTAVTTCSDSGGELSIAGEKFYDSNQDGILGGGEIGIGGWTIYLATSPNYPTGLVASVTTDTNGDFLFTNQPTNLPGQVQVTSLAAFTQYYVFEGAPTPYTTGWVQSLGGSAASVTGDPTNGSVGSQTTAYGVLLFPPQVGAGLNNSTGNNFGNYNPSGAVPQPNDVSVTKTDSVGGSSITGAIGTAIPGNSFTYTITVANNGPGLAAGISVNDSVPAGLSSFVWSGNGHINVTGAINDTIASLAVGGTVVYTVTAAVAPGATAQLTNTVTVNDAGDLNPNNNTATDLDNLTPHVDLGVTKTDNTMSYVPGTSTTYTIVVTNNGPSAVVGATIVDSLPTQATGGSWVLVSATGGATSGAANGVGALNTTGNLPVGATLTYHETITISGSATGNVTNSVTVQPPAGVIDTNPNNNTASDTDVPTPKVDLGVRKTANVTMTMPGNAVTYTITVTNYGPSTATSLKLVDAPAFLLNRVYIASTGTYNATTGQWSGLNLAKGQSIILTMKGKISPYAAGILHNVVTISAPNDTNPANNQAFFDIGIPPSKRFFLTSYMR